MPKMQMVAQQVVSVLAQQGEQAGCAPLSTGVLNPSLWPFSGLSLHSTKHRSELATRMRCRTSPSALCA